MSKRLIKSYVIILITVIILASIGGFIIYKPSVHNASAYELMKINGIGEYYSIEIVLYLDENENATIDDLDCIDGIGRITIKKLKKRWR